MTRLWKFAANVVHQEHTFRHKSHHLLSPTLWQPFSIKHFILWKSGKICSYICKSRMGTNRMLHFHVVYKTRHPRCRELLTSEDNVTLHRYVHQLIQRKSPLYIPSARTNCTAFSLTSKIVTLIVASSSVFRISSCFNTSSTYRFIVSKHFLNCHGEQNMCSCSPRSINSERNSTKGLIPCKISPWCLNYKSSVIRPVL